MSASGAKWGVLGGAFDPPHLGHFALAQAAADELGLERVLWVPSHQPPHKSATAMTPYEDRLAMVTITARRDRRFDVSRVEEEIEGNSYTVRTLAHLANTMPDVAFYFIVGADVLPELKDWFKPDRIGRWATLACGVRAGFDRPGPETVVVQPVVYFESPEVDISSTELRRRVRAGESISELVAPGVESYIADKGLYSDR